MLPLREPGPQRMDPAADTVPGFENDDRRTRRLRDRGPRRDRQARLRARRPSCRSATRWARLPRHSRSIHGGNMRLRPHNRHELHPASDVVVVASPPRPTSQAAHPSPVGNVESEMRKAIAASGAEVSVRYADPRRTGRSPDRSRSVVSRREHDESARDDRVVPTGSHGHAQSGRSAPHPQSVPQHRRRQPRTRSAKATTRTRRSTRPSAER